MPRIAPPATPGMDPKAQPENTTTPSDPGTETNLALLEAAEAKDDAKGMAEQMSLMQAEMKRMQAEMYRLQKLQGPQPSQAPPVELPTLAEVQKRHRSEPYRQSVLTKEGWFVPEKLPEPAAR